MKPQAALEMQCVMLLVVNVLNQSIKVSIQINMRCVVCVLAVCGAWVRWLVVQ